MKQLRITTSEPNFMGILGTPLVTPDVIGELIKTPTIYDKAYIHDDAEQLAGYDIPMFIDGDMGQFDAPQDILLMLTEKNYQCVATVVKLFSGKYYTVILKQ